MNEKIDEQHQHHTITAVTPVRDGWNVTFVDGTDFFVPTQAVVPLVGMAVRLYGAPFGTVRGLALDGMMIYYRTEAEQRERDEIETYGADAADWLARWDAGRTVWSISMGGLGPGYEQAIQITVAEILRHLLAEKYDPTGWENPATWEAGRGAIEAAGHANVVIRDLRLSGAQWGAALGLALHLYRRGPRAIMNDAAVKDRHIQVERAFPSGAPT